MRKLVIGMALASSALATPALAREGSWYIEADGGLMIVEDMDFDINGVSNANRLDFDTGYDFGGIIGYDFGMFRLETEASYRRANEGNSYRVGNVIYGGDEIDGGSSALSFMLNGLLDFGSDDGIQGFAGGGVGVARTKVQAFAPSGHNINDTDSGFAWQLLAGIRYPVTDNIDLGLKYRFFNADSVDVVNAAGQSVDTKFRSHSLLATIAYNFGAEAPPPPPPRRPRRLRRLRRPRRRLSATRARTSCSSTGISRTSRLRLRRSLTARSALMRTAKAFRSCWPVTLTVRVRRSTTWVSRPAATTRFVRI